MCTVPRPLPSTRWLFGTGNDEFHAFSSRRRLRVGQNRLAASSAVCGWIRSNMFDGRLTASPETNETHQRAYPVRVQTMSVTVELLHCHHSGSLLDKSRWP